jgi:uncharacterized Fe-S center protein
MSVVHFLDLRKEYKDSHTALFGRFLKKAGVHTAVEKNAVCAVKLHVGEEGNSNYVSPLYVRRVCDHIRNAGGSPVLADTTTLYRGRRYRGDLHISLAREHGFDFAPFIVGDGLYGDDYIDVNGSKIASLFTRVTSMICVSHFKGHLACGFGGAIKNLGMGCASKGGKLKIHSGSKPSINQKKCTRCLRCSTYCIVDAIKESAGGLVIDHEQCTGCGGCMSVCPEKAIVFTWDAASRDIQKGIARHAVDSVRSARVFYINFLINISPNCDCFHTNEPMITDDIGILASVDPVSLDQACYDMIKEEIDSLHPDVNAQDQLAFAEEFGLGERVYEIKKA